MLFWNKDFCVAAAILARLLHHINPFLINDRSFHMDNVLTI